MAVGDFPQEVTHGEGEGVSVFGFFRLGEARRVRLLKVIPIEFVEFAIGVFAAEKIDHRSEGFAIAEIGEVVYGRVFGFKQVDRGARRTVEDKWLVVYIDHGVSLWRRDDRVVRGKEEPVLAETGRKALPRFGGHR